VGRTTWKDLRRLIGGGFWVTFMVLSSCQRRPRQVDFLRLLTRIEQLERMLRESEARLEEKINNLTEETLPIPYLVPDPAAQVAEDAQAVSQEPETESEPATASTIPVERELPALTATTAAEPPARNQEPAPAAVAGTMAPATGNARPAAQETKQEPTGGAVAPVSEPPPATGFNVAATYKLALDHYYKSAFDEAKQGFEQILERAPRHKLAANARYWLGEVAYSRYQFDHAVEQFQHVVDDYPKSAKLPDALLKIGKCRERQGRIEDALAIYDQVIERFPTSEAAALAKSWL